MNLLDVNIDFQTSNKFRPIWGQYLVEPGTCAGCNRPPAYPEEPFISVQMELEFYGCVYFCLDCTKALATAIGWMGPNATEKIQETNGLLLDRILQLNSQNEYLKELLNVRINASGSREHDSHVAASFSFSETESDATPTDQATDGHESELDQSGSE